MFWIVALSLIIGPFSRSAFAQGEPSFSVAAIRRVEPGTRQGGSATEAAGRVTYRNAPLLTVILRAFEVDFYQVVGPAWLRTECYDISATMPEETTRTEVSTMLRNLLADRFGIKYHSEQRQVPVYMLVVARDGLKVKKSTDLGPRPGLNLGFTRSGEVHFRVTTLAGAAKALSGALGRPVLDATGVEGIFDIDIVAAPEDLVGIRSAPPQLFDAPAVAQGADDALSRRDPSVSLSDSLKSLGLRLEGGKAKLPHIIIDSANKTPTGN